MIYLSWNGKQLGDYNNKLYKFQIEHNFKTVELINQSDLDCQTYNLQENLQQNNSGQLIKNNIPCNQWRNKLILGDNKIVMQLLSKEFVGKIKLIYIDPPFATGSDYKFKLFIGEHSDESNSNDFFIEDIAYNDSWGKNLDSYLQMMYERFKLMKELLSEDGSIYVHLDWHVVHYIKVIMDEIFGYDNFINELIWFFKGTTNSPRMYADKHDNILFYAKNKNKYTFNADAIRIPYNNIKAYKQDDTGKWYKQWTKDKKYYPPQDFVNGKWVLKGKFRYDVIDDVPSMATAHGDEYLGFSTQKKEELLKIFILASSNENDLIADFFCGSGTTLAVAEKLKRRWIGCDISRYAIHITKKRLLDIHNSKDLMNKKNKYNQTIKPFEIINLYNNNMKYNTTNSFNNYHHNNNKSNSNSYDFVTDATNNDKNTILKLYGAEQIKGFAHFHGKKNNALVHVCNKNQPISFQEILLLIDECKSSKHDEIHILVWNWDTEFYSKIQDFIKKEAKDLKLQLIKIDSSTSGYTKSASNIHFLALANLSFDYHISNKTIIIELKDYILPNKDLIPIEILKKIKYWSDWIDFWAIDFDFNNIFNISWASFRTKKNRKLLLSAYHTYNYSSKYKICIKTVDILGVELSQLLEIEIR